MALHAWDYCVSIGSFPQGEFAGMQGAIWTLRPGLTQSSLRSAVSSLCIGDPRQGLPAVG